ncbi:MAG: hypothetical protein WC055_15655, partial [Melioribacteraceae bacterium]
MKKLNFKENIFRLVLLTAFIIVSVSFNSCEDTFGTDPFVKKVPKDPIDTTKTDSKMLAKEIFW